MHLDYSIEHISRDLCLRLKFQIIAGSYVTIDSPVDDDMGNLDLALHLRLFADHHGAWLSIDRLHPAKYGSVDTQPAGKHNVALNCSPHANQTINALLRGGRL